MNALILNQDIFQSIAKYLNHKDLCLLMLVCKQMKSNILLSFRLILDSNQLLHGNPTTPYNVIYRSIYNRETYFWSFDENVKPFKRRHTLGIDIKEFKGGLTFSAILSQTNQLYYCPSAQYVESVQNKPDFTIKKNVKQFSVLGKGRLLYLTLNGDLFIVFENMEERLLFQNVKLFDSSYYLGVVIFQNPQKLVQFDQNLVDGVQIQLSDATTENIEAPIRYKRIVNLPKDQIVEQLCVGAQQFFFLTKKQIVYASDINQKHEVVIIDQTVKVTQVPYFDHKHIIAIKAGLGYFIALGREEIKAIQDWENQQIVEWLGKKGFSDYQKIVQYSDFDGAEFSAKAVDKDFQKETLGMTNEDLKIKLSTEITRASQNSFKEYQIYGWGKNDYGQLAIPLSNNVQYSKLHLPPLDEDDEIIQIECGWKNLCILTLNGKIFMTENLQKLQKKENEKQQFNEEENNGNGKQKRKRSRQQQDQKEQKEQKEVVMPKYWSDISKVFVKANDKRCYKNYFINLSKDYLTVTCSIYDQKLAQQYFPELLEVNADLHKKFRSTIQVLDRIQWDPSLNKDDFIIGYEDRFLGIMEISMNDYLLSQVKSHRIRYFKKNNKIIWDRQRKIDLF